MNQLYFLDTPGECPECGIPFADDYELGVYSAGVLARARRRGLCVACSGLFMPSQLCHHEVASSASLTSVRATWGCKSVGLGLSDGSNLRCIQDAWPSMEEFAACLEQQLELSSEDELFRRLVRARNDIAVAAEEFEDEENELKSAG